MSKLEILDAPSFAPNQNPKKLIFMLHGYGDNADNFIHIANSLYINELKINLESSTLKENDSFSIIFGPLTNEEANNLVLTFISKGYKKTEIIIE